jgi:dehydrogenase/reductase SDR family protein 4
MLANKSALVVGGTHGIGLSVAEAMLGAGATLVMVCSRKQASVDAAVAKLASRANSRDVRVLGFTCNVSSLSDIAALYVQVQQALGSRALDCLVSNVGVDPVSGPALAQPDSVFDKIFDSNVKAGWRLCRAFYPKLARGSSVLLVTSTGGFQPQTPSGLYGASKTAVIGLGRALASELGPEGIRVNVIAPGLVKTRMSEAFWKGPFGPVAEQNLFLRRLGQPQDIASVAVFLLSDAAGWMTGETVVVSGGTHTRL